MLDFTGTKPRYDPGRRIVLFAARDRHGDPVYCGVTRAALLKLSGEPAEHHEQELLALFDAHRLDIQTAAIRKYERATLQQGVFLVSDRDLGAGRGAIAEEGAS